MAHEHPCASAGCGTPATGTARICDDCLGRLERALGDVRALTRRRDKDLARELEVTVYRQNRTGDGTSGRRAAKDDEWLPWNQPAAEAGWVLGNTLTTWARVLLDGERPLPRLEGPTHERRCLHPSCTTLRKAREQYPTSTDPADLAAWMLHRLPQVRQHPAAEQLVDEIVIAVRAVEHAVDRPSERWYAGPCGGRHVTVDDDTSTELEVDCDAELYAAPGAEHITCRQCGTNWDVADRRKWLLAEAEDALAYAELIAQALSALGQPLKGDRVRKWVERQRLVAHGTDLQGRPLYRVGDVIDLLTEDARLAEKRAAKQAEREERARRHASSDGTMRREASA